MGIKGGEFRSRNRLCSSESSQNSPQVSPAAAHGRLAAQEQPAACERGSSQKLCEEQGQNAKRQEEALGNLQAQLAAFKQQSDTALAQLKSELAKARAECDV